MHNKLAPLARAKKQRAFIRKNINVRILKGTLTIHYKPFALKIDHNGPVYFEIISQENVC